MPHEVADGSQINDAMLDIFIKKFGKGNTHIINGRQNSVAWFISHCDAKSNRGNYVVKLTDNIDVNHFVISSQKKAIS